MDINNLITFAGLIYPALLFVLPSRTASKIDLGIKIIKKIVDVLDSAKNTKAGFSFKKEE